MPEAPRPQGFVSPDTPKKPHPTTEERQALPPFVGLPLEAIRLLSAPEELAQAIERMRAAKFVGFDTESRPSFVAGRSTGGPHLVQLALHDVAFLIPTRLGELLGFLRQVLESSQIIKVGFGLSSDRAPLYRNFGIALNGVVDLPQSLRALDYKNELGAQAAVAVVLKQNLRKSKRMTMSNWQKARLEPAQLQYAADDALAALRVHDAIGRPMPLPPRQKKGPGAAEPAAARGRRAPASGRDGK